MTRIEYIRLSHRHTNRKIRERLQAVRTRLDAKSRWLGGAWQAVAWVLYSIVSVVSWLAFAAEMFKDNRFSLHYMECEIEHRNLSAAEARQYIADKKQEYDRWLAYGSISAKEQRRIDIEAIYASGCTLSLAESFPNASQSRNSAAGSLPNTRSAYFITSSQLEKSGFI